MEFKDWYEENASRKIRRLILDALDNPEKPKWSTQRLNNLLSRRVNVHPTEKAAIEAIAEQELTFSKVHKKLPVTE